jgi:hypothetical protein
MNDDMNKTRHETRFQRYRPYKFKNSMSELDGSRMLRRGFVARRFLCTNWTELQHLRLAFQPRRKTRCILRCEPPKAHFWRQPAWDAFAAAFQKKDDAICFIYYAYYLKVLPARILITTLGVVLSHANSAG